MGLLDNLAKIVAAPVKVVDQTVAKPLADLADLITEGFEE